jgi:hypothetical protein
VPITEDASEITKSPEGLLFMGVSTAAKKEGEEVYLDINSINKSSGRIHFTYKIGDELITAIADCDANRWYAKSNNTGKEYKKWYSPESQATKNMIKYVCKSS